MAARVKRVPRRTVMLNLFQHPPGLSDDPGGGGKTADAGAAK
jgi:hypothetical protein